MPVHRAAVVLAAALALCGHVGSPDTFFEGAAGPYRVRVIVRAPGVVPGLAQISVRLIDHPAGVRSVTVQAAQWNVGSKGAPAPDAATPVPGETSLYSADLWFMTGGSYAVNVGVDGDAGRGTAIVPVMSVATRTLPMDGRLGLVLAGLGAFLFVGAVTIVGASVREAVVPPGKPVDRTRVRRARFVSAGAIVLFGLMVYGGGAWWTSEASDYAASLYKPFETSVAVSGDAANRTLTLRILDEDWNEGVRWTPLMPDHGKLMHMFVVREGSLDAFAHLHPQSVDHNTFRTPLPALPAGAYRVYADIVHESGYAQTLTASVTLPAPPASTPSLVFTGDPDDAGIVGANAVAAYTAADPILYPFDDGTQLVWQTDRAPLVVGRETLLSFALVGADGRVQDVELYMGMRGHAVVLKNDGTVFVHLHPGGTISMAALKKFQQSEGAAAPAADHSAHAMREEGQLAIPYAFPSAGRYRLWVQVKRNGRIQTAAFDAVVGEEKVSD